MQHWNTAYLSDAVRVLRSRVSRYAYWGLAIAVAAVAVATAITAYLSSGEITLSSVLAAQRANISLLMLDLMPFAFALWGQYVGILLSHEAGAIVLDQPRGRRTDNAALAAQAKRQNEIDSLTGLANRAFFIDMLEQAMAGAHLERARLGIMVLDLDGFQEVNDMLGQNSGDRVLKNVGRRLTLALPEPALVARLRGDTFAILLPEAQSRRDLAANAQRIERGLEPPCMLDSLSLNLHASVGGAMYPEHALDAYSLLNAADAAMQEAKACGGGFHLYQIGRPLRDARMHSLSAELGSAIAQDQLVLHLQPIVDAQTDRVHGVEALVRWQHPRRGLIMPADFIARAERSGIIRDLSNWVLRRALQHVADLRRGGWPLCLSVNLSARSLLDPDFPDVLAGLLTTCNLPSHCLTLEITEDTLMADQQRTHESVTRVANMGVQISIDDFGTGYSQLAYLKRLPVSEIKIDRSFVQDMLVSRTDQSIVQATLGLAHALGLRAVGEGIESQAQAEHLRALGCDLIQGFLIGRPMPLDQLVRWLERWPTNRYAPGAGAPPPGA